MAKSQVVGVDSGADPRAELLADLANPAAAAQATAYLAATQTALLGFVKGLPSTLCARCYEEPVPGTQASAVEREYLTRVTAIWEALGFRKLSAEQIATLGLTVPGLLRPVIYVAPIAVQQVLSERRLRWRLANTGARAQRRGPVGAPVSREEFDALRAEIAEVRQ